MLCHVFLFVLVWCLSDLKQNSTAETSSIGLEMQVTALFWINLGKFQIVFCDSTCDDVNKNETDAVRLMIQYKENKNALTTPFENSHGDFQIC